MRFRLTILAVCALALSAWSGLGILAGGNEPNSAPPLKPAGLSKLSDQPHSLKLANGMEVPAYPDDARDPYGSTTWAVPLAYSVTDVKYNPGQRELSVRIDFTIGSESEKSLLAKLVANYKLNGRPTVDADAISIVRMQPIAYSIRLEHEGRKFEVYQSDPGVKTLPTQKVITFAVPMTAEYDRLHRKLSDNPASVEIVVRGHYEFTKVAGGRFETKILASAWEAVRDKLEGPKGEKPGHELLVSRIGLVEVKLQLRNAAKERVILMCEPKDREFVMASLDKLIERAMARLESPLDVLKLHELGDNLVVWTPHRNGPAEVSPVTHDNIVKKSKEFSKEQSTLMSKAKEISQKADYFKNNIKEFHKEARKLNLAVDVRVRAVIWGGSAKMNLSTDYEKLSNAEKEEVKSAQSFIQNENEYLSSVSKEWMREMEGDERYKNAIAKVLNIHRISSSALLSETIGLGEVTWINGIETVAIDRPLPLVATQGEKANDTVAGLKKKYDELETKSRMSEMKITEINEKLMRLEKGKVRVAQQTVVFVYAKAGEKMEAGIPFIYSPEHTVEPGYRYSLPAGEWKDKQVLGAIMVAADGNNATGYQRFYSRVEKNEVILITARVKGATNNCQATVYVIYADQ